MSEPFVCCCGFFNALFALHMPHATCHLTALALANLRGTSFWYILIAICHAENEYTLPTSPPPPHLVSPNGHNANNGTPNWPVPRKPDKSSALLASDICAQCVCFQNLKFWNSQTKKAIERLQRCALRGQRGWERCEQRPLIMISFCLSSAVNKAKSD